MKFNNVAFTKHALERIDLRTVTREMVIKTIQDPNKQFSAEGDKIKFIRKVNGCKVHAICKPIPEENKWLVITVWVRGEDNYGNQTSYKSYRKSKSSSGLSISFVISIMVILYVIWQLWLQTA